jgi:hypothetical protein
MSKLDQIHQKVSRKVRVGGVQPRVIFELTSHNRNTIRDLFSNSAAGCDAPLRCTPRTPQALWHSHNANKTSARGAVGAQDPAASILARRRTRGAARDQHSLAKRMEVGGALVLFDEP